MHKEDSFGRRRLPLGKRNPDHPLKKQAKDLLKTIPPSKPLKDLVKTDEMGVGFATRSQPRTTIKKKVAPITPGPRDRMAALRKRLRANEGKVNELKYTTMNKYMSKAQRSMDTAKRSHDANILRGTDPSKDKATVSKRSKGMKLAKSRAVDKIRKGHKANEEWETIKAGPRS